MSVIETVSATDFRKDFGTCIDMAARGPVRITRKDQEAMIVMPLAEYERLTGK